MAIDDILVLPAAFLNIAVGVAIAIRAQLKIIGGHSLPAITQTEQIQLDEFKYAFWIGYILAIGVIKLMILCFSRLPFNDQLAKELCSRLVGTSTDLIPRLGRSYWTAFDCASWTLITLVLLSTVVFFFFEILACGSHPEASWSSLDSLRNKCVDTFGLQAGCAVFSWVLDLAMFIGPF
ncbi:hypothetical protein F4782DRAFT_552952 [Xylaria castorea]|nr:hypothetical protein F4782DRAFT_552952 [Xylaria castorea]